MVYLQVRLEKELRGARDETEKERGKRVQLQTELNQVRCCTRISQASDNLSRLSRLGVISEEGLGSRV